MRNCLPPEPAWQRCNLRKQRAKNGADNDNSAKLKGISFGNSAYQRVNGRRRKMTSQCATTELVTSRIFTVEVRICDGSRQDVVQDYIE